MIITACVADDEGIDKGRLPQVTPASMLKGRHCPECALGEFGGLGLVGVLRPAQRRRLESPVGDGRVRTRLEQPPDPARSPYHAA